jgi:hypothetical protein
MGTGPLPVVPPNVPTVVNVGDVAQQEVDPSNFGNLFSQGASTSGWIERLAIAIWTALVKGLTFFISLLAGILDELLSALANFFLAAQGQSNKGFYDLTAALITDLTGLDVSGDTLFSNFQSRGRVAAMQAVGSQLVDALAGEFAGTYQADAGGVFKGGKGDGIGGLPAVPLSPEQGMNAARAFMGFVMSFAVREGNTDIFASLLPYGIGEGFKSYAEDFSKSLGLGRLSRLALKPLFQNLVSIPMTWAFNKQYTPTLLGVEQTIRAFNAGLYTGDQLNEELSRHGYSMERRNALQSVHTKYPPESDLFLLELAGQIDTATHTNILSRIGYDSDEAAYLLKAEQLHTARHLSLRLAETLVHPLLTGLIDIGTYTAVLNRFTLTDKEKQDLTGFAVELLAHPRKRLTFAQVTTAFLDGILAVGDIQSYLQQEGYSQDDIAALLEIDLLKLKAAQAKAAGKKTTTPPPVVPAP